MQKNSTKTTFMKNKPWILLIIVIFLWQSIHAAFEVKEIMYLPYKTYFKDASVNNFWVDSNKLYILDSYNIRVLEFSLETGKKTGDYKINRNFGDTLHPQADLLVFKNNVFILEHTRVNHYDMLTGKYTKHLYSKVPYNKNEYLNLQSMFFFSSVNDGRLYVSQLGVSGVIWDNGKWIKPEKVIVEEGQRFSKRVAAQARHGDVYNAKIVHFVGKEKNEVSIGDYSAKIIGANENGVYVLYGRSMEEFKTYNKNIGYISEKSNTFDDTIEIPKIVGAPLSKNFIFVNNSIYYLMGDKDGFRLFLLTRVPSSQTSSGFEKYNYNYDFKDKK